MNLQFNEKKATQAAALFLKLADNRQLNYMVLIKDLYLADKEALSNWGRPITNDQYYSMKCGPVLSNVLDLIHEEPMPDETIFWAEYISPPSNYEVTLVKDPGLDLLSVAEENLIKSIFEKYKYYQTEPFKFVEYLHSSLPEWDRRTHGRSEITIRSMLLSAQKTPDEINDIENELVNIASVNSYFGIEN